MGIAAATMIALQILAGEPAISAYYTESIFPGRVIGPQTSIGLCANSDEEAAKAMREIVQIASDHGNFRDKVCTIAVLEDWKVVRGVSDRCEVSAEGEWCAIEAHVVVAERNGERKYAMILVKEDQLN